MSAHLDEADRIARPQSPEQRARVDAAARAVAAHRGRVRADAYAAPDAFLIDPHTQPCTTFCATSSRDMSIPGSSCACVRVGVRYGEDEGAEPRAVVIPCSSRESKRDAPIADQLARREITPEEATEKMRLAEGNRTFFSNGNLDANTKEETTMKNTSRVTMAEVMEDATLIVAAERVAMERFLAGSAHKPPSIEGAPPREPQPLEPHALLVPLPPQRRQHFDARDRRDMTSREEVLASFAEKREADRNHAAKVAAVYGNGR